MIDNENLAKVWANNNWVNFKIKTGRHTNIITFLDDSNISFIKDMPIDFTNILIPIHGNGNSNNLLDYLSNNERNDYLIKSFLPWFLSMLDIRYADGDKIKIIIINNSDWRKSNIIVEPQYSTFITVDTTKIIADSTTITADTLNKKS